MNSTLLAAHLSCLLLVGMDILARGWRTNACLRGFGHPLPFGRVLETNLWGEAAAALSPFRMAGEPARIGGMLFAGAPLAATVVTSATEGTVNGAAILLVGMLLVLGFAPEWWDEAGPAVTAHVRAGAPVLLAVVVAIVVSVWLLGRSGLSRPAGRARWRERVRELWQLWAGAPRTTLLAVFLLSIVSVAARTLLLPLLALAVPGHPGFGVLWVGSFMMVYSQLALPVPAGAGAVDLAFFAGVAGDQGSSAATVLIAWRAYSLGIATVAGCALAVHRFGARPLWRFFRTRRPPGSGQGTQPPAEPGWRPGAP